MILRTYKTSLYANNYKPRNLIHTKWKANDSPRTCLSTPIDHQIAIRFFLFKRRMNRCGCTIPMSIYFFPFSVVADKEVSTFS